jgi:hypothetical protein
MRNSRNLRGLNEDKNPQSFALSLYDSKCWKLGLVSKDILPASCCRTTTQI